VFAQQDKEIMMSITEINNAVAPALPSNTRSVVQPSNAEGVRETTSSVQSNARTEQSKDAQVRPEELKSAVEKVQTFVSATTSDVNFSIDKDSGNTVVKVIDRSTKEVIRQIPSKEMLEMAQALDRLQGLLVKNQA
jgi:flagellar protein FlaG